MGQGMIWQRHGKTGEMISILLLTSIGILVPKVWVHRASLPARCRLGIIAGGYLHHKVRADYDPIQLCSPWLDEAQPHCASSPGPHPATCKLTNAESVSRGWQPLITNWHPVLNIDPTLVMSSLSASTYIH